MFNPGLSRTSRDFRHPAAEVFALLLLYSLLLVAEVLRFDGKVSPTQHMLCNFQASLLTSKDSIISDSSQQLRRLLPHIRNLTRSIVFLGTIVAMERVEVTDVPLKSHQDDGIAE